MTPRCLPLFSHTTSRHRADELVEDVESGLSARNNQQTNDDVPRISFVAYSLHMAKRVFNNGAIVNPTMPTYMLSVSTEVLLTIISCTRHHPQTKMPKNDENFIFPIADGTVKLSGRDRVFRRPTSIRDHPARGEEHKDVHQGESDGSQPIEQQTDDAEARNDFWTISGNFIFRHHVELRIKLYVPNEESFPIPLDYIDVVRRTNTTLYVLLESGIDDDCNIDGWP